MDNILYHNDWLTNLVMMVKSGGGTNMGKLGRKPGGGKGNNEITDEIKKKAKPRVKGEGFGSKNR